MSRTLKRILVTVGGVVGLLVLAACAVLLFVDVDRYKPRLEAAASDALGMDVRVDGRLGMGFFPDLHLTVADARILGEQGVVVASAKRTRLGIALLPLLRGDVRLHRLELTQPRLSLVRDPGGRLNVERLEKAVALLGSLDGASVSLSDGTLPTWTGGRGKGSRPRASQLKVSRMRLAGGGNPWLGKGLFPQGASSPAGRSGRRPSPSPPWRRRSSGRTGSSRSSRSRWTSSAARRREACGRTSPAPSRSIRSAAPCRTSVSRSSSRRCPRRRPWKG